MKIGVFDSGLGGKFVADDLQTYFPEAQIIYVNDRAHLPYGRRSAPDIQKLTLAAIQPLIQVNCPIIVIACNSATTNAINKLRAAYPQVFFVGLEPMIKPASQATQTNIVAVCATPATLKSANYQQLVKLYGNGLNILQPDCSTWAELIEAGQDHKIDVESLAAELVAAGCDSLVLGCTHYHYLKPRFRAAAPSLMIFEPTAAIAKRIITSSTD